MRDYDITPENAPGPPIFLVAEKCDENGCEQRYVLPYGDLATMTDSEWSTPSMPRIADMPTYLEKAGWTRDDERWLCPHDGPVHALPVDADADSEQALQTQEFDPSDFIEQPAEDETDNPNATRPDGVPVPTAALAGHTDQAEEANSDE